MINGSDNMNKISKTDRQEKTNNILRLSAGSYLRQVVDVRVLHLLQGVDGSSEGVDLLVWVSHQDLAAGLRQHHVHDD